MELLTRYFSQYQFKLLLMKGKRAATSRSRSPRSARKQKTSRGRSPARKLSKSPIRVQPLRMSKTPTRIARKTQIPIARCLFECSVCMEELSAIEKKKQPHVLSCGHSFCFECLSALVKENRVMCPACRDVTQLYDGVSLKKNFGLIEVLHYVVNGPKEESIAVSKVVERESVQRLECYECDVQTYTVCLMCPGSPAMCNNCFSVIHVTPKRKNHQLSFSQETIC